MQGSHFEEILPTYNPKFAHWELHILLLSGEDDDYHWSKLRLEALVYNLLLVNSAG